MKYMFFLILPVLFWQLQISQAQIPPTEWIKTHGGSNIDIGHAVDPTMEGGYIIAGYTRSFGTMSGRNVWLVKTDSAGNEQWNNAFGGNDDEEAYTVLQTPDGGYVLAGYTKSFGMGLNDVLLIKADSSGTSQWIRTFGGAQDDEAYGLDETSDGGFIVAGVTSSSGAGSRDVFLVKTDASGNAEWEQTLGGFSSDGARSVQQTSDGGYILTGWTLSYGPGFLGNAWLVKTDSAGIEEWNQVFGGNDVDRGFSVRETTDGGFILTGYTSSSGAGLDDLLLIKTDSSGNEEWTRTFGGSGRDYGHAVRQTADGGFIITGYTLSFGAGGDDLWLVKTDAGGNLEWQNTYGGGSSDIGYDVNQTPDGGYIVTGHTLSSGAGLHDVFLIRLAAPAMPRFVVTPDSLRFGVAAIGDTLLDSLLVQNTGDADLTIASATFSNPGYSIYPVTAIISPDSSVQFQVQFSAANPGPQNGFLTFFHNAPGSPDTVYLEAEVLTGTAFDEGSTSGGFILYQNYPNPFNPATVISWQLAVGSPVNLAVYNTVGQKVTELVNEIQPPGKYSIEFQVEDLPSGIYFYRLETGDFVETRKMILVK